MEFLAKIDTYKIDNHRERNGELKISREAFKKIGFEFENQKFSVNEEEIIKAIALIVLGDPYGKLEAPRQD